MRYTSLAVELLRARPVFVVWSAILFQTVLWLAVPLVFYGAPPGDVATVIAIGRDYQVGTQFGPPLAFWLADIAFTLAGGTMFGVYLLTQVCSALTLWALFLLGRAIAGAQHAVLAVLLTITIAAFSFPSIEFGPDVLARPLWALALLHYWRAVGQGERRAWFALSLELGLLLLTSMTGWLLAIMLVVFSAATRRGRAAFASTDPLYVLIVIVTLLAPFLIWLALPGSIEAIAPRWPRDVTLVARLTQWPLILFTSLLMLAGIALLVAFNVARAGRAADDAPLIYRAPVEPFARQFIYTFAIAPLLVASLTAALFDLPTPIGGSGLHLVLAGLAIVLLAGDLIYLRQQRQLRAIWLGVVVAPALFVIGQIMVAPWLGGTELKTALPANDIGAFFADSFQRRTGKPLPAVAGETSIAALVALSAPSRPHLMLPASERRSPATDAGDLRESGGVVVWRAADTVGLPPAEVRAQFQDLTPEVPRAFELFIQGRRPLLRIGWAIVRPSDKAASTPVGLRGRLP